MSVPDPTPIVHITNIANLSRIVERGLRCCAELRRDRVGYADSANTEIQDRRATFAVPVPPGGMVHDYVPFYFHPRSPMLYVISRGGSRYPTGQSPIVHLVTTVQAVSSCRPFVFTDGHAIMSLSEYSTDLTNLGRIDWPLMRSVYWNDTASDPDRKRRRQAEFLVHEHLPWNLISAVGVYDGPRQAEVVKILEQSDHRPPVHVLPKWYY